MNQIAFKYAPEQELTTFLMVVTPQKWRPRGAHTWAAGPGNPDKPLRESNQPPGLQEQEGSGRSRNSWIDIPGRATEQAKDV